jgi:hypothetical protein
MESSPIMHRIYFLAIEHKKKNDREEQKVGENIIRVFILKRL